MVWAASAKARTLLTRASSPIGLPAGRRCWRNFWPRSVDRRFLSPLDHYHFNRTFLRLQAQPHLLLNGGRQRRHVALQLGRGLIRADLGLIGRPFQLVIVLACKAGL